MITSSFHFSLLNLDLIVLILHEFLCFFPVDEYERTWEQNEELGLNDMDTSSADMAYNKSDGAWCICKQHRLPPDYREAGGGYL